MASKSAATGVSDLLLIVDPVTGLYEGGLVANGLESESSVGCTYRLVRD